ncbi:MAG TPA: tetratricopeptide repeat protein [Steroidobacteraceae bacterium]
MQQPRHHRAKPLDDEMHAYNSKDLERLFGLPASAVRSLARAGHISPIKRAGRLHYSFQDLLMMRTASALRAANISAHRINRTLETFRETLPTGAASNQRSLTAMGNQIAIREGKMLWESESGQYALDLGEDKGELHVISRPLPAAPVAKSADELYAQAFALEDTDPDAACAIYEAALEVDPEHVEARINFGRLLHMAGRLSEAERVYRGASKPESLIIFNLAVVLEDLKREPDAIGAYRESLALDPGLADAHFNLARLYERAKNPKASLRHLLAYRRMMDRQGT